MIDPLMTAPLPQFSRSTAREGQPGAPSFLEWALTQPGTMPNPEDHPGQGGENVPASVPQTPDPALAIPMPMIVESVATPASATMPLPARSDASAEGTAPSPGTIAPAPPTQGRIAADTSDIDGVEPGTADPSAMVVAPFDASEALHGQERLATTLSFHVRKPQGEREVVALPWRLMASGRLAQSRADGGAFVSPGATGGTTVVAPSVHAASPGPLRAEAPVHAGSDAVGSMRTETPPAPFPSSMGETRDAGRSAPATMGMASSPVAAEWMARWIKWVERDGHDPALWLRDYRIDDAETRRVVDALRGLAREQGISLERIVVNGREFWRNPDHEPNRSKE